MSSVMQSSNLQKEEWQSWLKTISHYFATGEISQICNVVNDNRYYAKLKIFGKEFVGLLDTGATVSVISKYTAHKISKWGLNSHAIPKTKISTADGTVHHISSRLDLPVEFSNGYHVIDFLIMDGLKHDILLGMNFFKAFGLSIEQKEIISSNVISNLECEDLKRPKLVISRNDLSNAQKLQLDKVITDIKDKIGKGLGRTDYIEHKIDTEDALPVSHRQYPFSPHIMNELDKELEEMLKLGVIEPSYSSWRSPVLLVKKATGKNRLCLDSRQLNKLTKKDSYPLPRVSTILDSLKNAHYLSTLDLKSAFWQIPLENSSKEKTAFGLPGKGLFQFKVMPFGLVNASQTQQRLMDKLFPPEFEGKVFTYLDDIVVSTQTFNEHIITLNWVKDQLLKAGLTVNVDKCHFARDSLKYLGYLVDRDGLRTDPEKVNAILNYPKPRTYTDLKRFLGLASWYRRFVENFAMVAGPLHDLTKGGKKGKGIVWNEEAEKAFTDLKTALTSTPVLSCPNFSLEFIVQCDASNKGTGAVLSQIVDDLEQPIAFTSRKLTERESKYSASERELLSVIHAIEQFRPYVEGTHFKIITDHSALQWLYKAKDPHGRLARWAMKLQQFDYEIIYRRGKENVVPDALSRAVSDEEINAIDIRLEDKDLWYKDIEDSVTKGEADSSWALSHDLLWKYLKLKQFPDANDSWKLVVPDKLRRQVLQDCHDHPLSGHFGVKKTCNKVRQKYFWPNIIKDVKDYVRRCETCAKYKVPQLPPIGHMGKHREVSQPFQIVSLDLMGPFPRSKSGNTMLLVVSCWFSKFVLLYPLRNGKVSNIIRIIEEQIFLMFGVPKVIICDNGKQFTSNQFKELLEDYNTEIWFTPYYHPQANPTERVNRVIGTAISSYVQDNHKEWDKYIPHIGHAIRTAVHEVTGKTPSYLFFGRETTHIGQSIIHYDKENTLNFNRNMNEKLILQREIYKDVEQRLKRAYEVNSKRYNTRRRVCNFAVGDLVWKKTKPLSKANNQFMAKLSPKYEKAIIAEKVSTDVYILKNMKGKSLGKWHSCDLKRLM
jgi:transposase InsO family protein